MWSLVALIAILIFWFFKSTCDYADSCGFEIKYRKEEKKCDEFFAKYGISEMEMYKLKDYLRYEQCDEIVELNNFLTELTGYAPTWDMLLWGYLATKGKIPCKSVVSSSESILNASYPQNWCSKVPSKEYHGRAHPSELITPRIKYLRWYNETLRSNGVNEDIMFAPENPYSKELIYVYDSKKIQSIRGISDDQTATFFWLSTRVINPEIGIL
ncbi:MAG: hypothetical protein ACI4RC_07435 [Oscillospiraceae bacterium]